jgi:hypothetical protein
MLHCRITLTDINVRSVMQMKAGRSRKIAFVHDMEWL